MTTGIFSFFKDPSPAIRRGASAIFLCTFSDPNGNPVTPVGATVQIAFKLAGVKQSTSVTMLPPGSVGGDPNQWYAAWDTRGVDVGTVYWSIHTSSPIPISADDGNFSLVANPANTV